MMMIISVSQCEEQNKALCVFLIYVFSIIFPNEKAFQYPIYGTSENWNALNTTFLHEVVFNLHTCHKQ